MSRRFKFFGVVVILLCLTAVIAGWIPVSNASEIEANRPASALAETQAGAQAASTLADEGVQVVYDFSPFVSELPEGVTIDKSGNIYAAGGTVTWFPNTPPYGAVWKISPDGEKTLLHEFPEGPGASGLAVSPSGVLYFGYPNPGFPDNGVYRLAGDGEPERLPGSENIIVANGLALTAQGDLYVSDSAMGAIWRIPHSGEEAEIWSDHSLMAGCGPDDFGANGVAFWKDSLYVANTFRGALVRVPILKDGTAGEPEIVAGDEDCEFDELFGMDGIALDVHGNVFALLVMQHKLVRIDPKDGSYTVLLTEEDGLFNPASIAFGTGRGDRKYVFMSNFALLEPGPVGNLGPSVLKYNVGVPGLPLPIGPRIHILED
jgi:sugar lactone lactonase YvrE